MTCTAAPVAADKPAGVPDASPSSGLKPGTPTKTPWHTGAQVEHRTYGFGIVHSRTDEQVAVIFKKDPPGRIRHFVLALIGSTMRVTNQ